jgi:hypothetical protein
MHSLELAKATRDHRRNISTDLSFSQPVASEKRDLHPFYINQQQQHISILSRRCQKRDTMNINNISMDTRKKAQLASEFSANAAKSLVKTKNCRRSLKTFKADSSNHQPVETSPFLQIYEIEESTSSKDYKVMKKNVIVAASRISNNEDRLKVSPNVVVNPSFIEGFTSLMAISEDRSDQDDHIRIYSLSDLNKDQSHRTEHDHYGRDTTTTIYATISHCPRDRNVRNRHQRHRRNHNMDLVSIIPQLRSDLDEYGYDQNNAKIS